MSQERVNLTELRADLGDIVLLAALGRRIEIVMRKRVVAILGPAAPGETPTTDDPKVAA